MKKILIIAIIILLKSTGQAQDDYQKGESPYFIIRGGENSMPLLDTRADVNIAGTIADVKITQVYTNNGKKTDRGNLRFPGINRCCHPRVDHDNKRKSSKSKNFEKRKTQEKLTRKPKVKEKELPCWNRKGQTF